MSESNFWGVNGGVQPHTIQNGQGTDFPARTRLRFSGAAIVTDIDGITVVTIPSGRQGETGPAGEQGPMPTLEIMAETLVYTSQATASVTPVSGGYAVVIGVPQGIPGEIGPIGPQGEAGPQGIQGIQGVQGPKGERGEQGPASISIGTVTTGAPGSAAIVTNTGTTQDVVLNFVIPAGAQGVKGDTGEQGPQGPAGTAGADGADGAPIWIVRSV